MRFGARDLRAQSAPGFPCALSSGEGQRDCITRAELRCGNEKVCRYSHSWCREQIVVKFKEENQGGVTVTGRAGRETEQFRD